MEELNLTFNPVRKVGNFTKLFEKNQYVCHEGECGNSMFVVLEGEVEILKADSGSDKELTVAVVKKGGFFGEVALVTGGSRSASARIKTENALIAEISKSIFFYLVGQNPTFTLLIIHHLCQIISHPTTYNKDID